MGGFPHFYFYTMAEYSFKPDVIVGEDGEDFTIQYLIMHWKGTLIEQRRDYMWDFSMEFPNSGYQTFEIKTDVYCIPDKEFNGLKIKGTDTGNLFIEYECRGKKSGINVTTATWFVTYFKYLNELWFITTDKLKTLINENNFPIGVGGDVGSNSTGYLIPREKYRKHFIVKEV